MISFVLLAPLFWAGYFLSGFLFWLNWAGFARLCFLYQARRRGHFFKDFFLPSWCLSLSVYSVCFFWISIHEAALYVMVILVFSFFLPLLFSLHHLLTLKIRSVTAQVAVMFGVFFALEYFMSWVPGMESIGIDPFFRFPSAALCVLKFISFKVWSSWIFATCFTLACWFREKKAGSLVLLGVLAGGLIILALIAHIQNKSLESVPQRTAKVALVQLNLPYAEEWRTDHFERVKKKYLEMGLKAALGAPDLIIFPLYNLPGDVYRKPDFLRELARSVKRPFLVTTDAPIKAGDDALELGFMKLALLYTPEGKVMDIYKAVEAIPFTDQYVEKAENYRVIQGPFGKLGVLICFEDMVPRFPRQAARDGANLLVVLANPGFFQKTPIPRFELFQGQVRAAETGLPLVRVTSNGYSAMVDRTGKIVQKTALDTEEILQVQIPLGPSSDTQ